MLVLIVFVLYNLFANVVLNWCFRYCVFWVVLLFMLVFVGCLIYFVYFIAGFRFVVDFVDACGLLYCGLLWVIVFMAVGLLFWFIDVNCCLVFAVKFVCWLYVVLVVVCFAWFINCCLLLVWHLLLGCDFSFVCFSWRCLLVLGGGFAWFGCLVFWLVLVYRCVRFGLDLELYLFRFGVDWFVLCGVMLDALFGW